MCGCCGKVHCCGCDQCMKSVVETVGAIGATLEQRSLSGTYVPACWAADARCTEMHVNAKLCKVPSAVAWLLVHASSLGSA